MDLNRSPTLARLSQGSVVRTAQPARRRIGTRCGSMAKRHMALLPLNVIEVRMLPSKLDNVLAKVLGCR
jgi:hypothetical protein